MRKEFTDPSKAMAPDPTGRAGPRAPSSPENAKPNARREYCQWTAAEEREFYLVLKSCIGQKAEAIVLQGCKAIETKSYKQVRDYYYRLHKRLNQMLSEDLKLDARSLVPLHYAMLRFWEVLTANGLNGTNLLNLKKHPRKKKLLTTTVVKSIQAALKKAKQHEEAMRKSGAVETSAPISAKRAPVRKRGAAAASCPGPSSHAHVVQSSPMGGQSSEASIELPACAPTAEPPALLPTAELPTYQLDAAPPAKRACPPIRATPSQTDAPNSADNWPGKLEIRFLPATEGDRSRMDVAGLNPYLELVCGASKTARSVLDHLGRKWAAASVGEGCIRTLTIWHGREEHASVWGSTSAASLDLRLGELHLRLGCPVPFELRYAWRRSMEAATGVSSGAAALPTLNARLSSLTQPGLGGGSSLSPVGPELPPSCVPGSSSVESANFDLGRTPIPAGFQLPDYHPPHEDVLPTDLALGGRHLIDPHDSIFGSTERKVAALAANLPSALPDLDFSLKSWPDLSPASLPGGEGYSSASRLVGPSNFSRFFSLLPTGSTPPDLPDVPPHKGAAPSSLEGLGHLTCSLGLGSLLGTPGHRDPDRPDPDGGQSQRLFASLFDS